MRGDRRQLRHLMPAWLADDVARVQSMRAVATRVRHEIDGRIHAFGGHERAMVSGMARLTTGLAATLHPATAKPLATGEAS